MQIITRLIAALLGACVATSALAQGVANVGISHSSVYGTTGDVSLAFGDPKVSNTTGQISYRGGQEGHEAALDVSHRFQNGWSLDVSLASQNWSVDSFASHSASASLVKQLPLLGTNDAQLGGFVEWDDVFRADPSTSAVIAQDFGQSMAGGVFAQAKWSQGDQDGFQPTERRSSFASTATLAFAGDRQYASLVGRARFDAPLSDRLFLRSYVQAGHIQALDGGHVSVLDRVFLGSSSPRGFAYGGFGPKDAVTNASLGGTEYVSGSVEAFTRLGQTPAFLGAFYDFATLDTVPGAASGTVTPDGRLRDSYGLSFNWESRFGALALSWATIRTTYSGDAEQRIAIQLHSQF